jgi:hypothetical protein
MRQTETRTRDEIARQYASAAALQLKARTSVLSQIEAFEPRWITGGVHREICMHLDGVLSLVEKGEKNPHLNDGGPRLILQTPPGIGKTLMSGVHFISHAMGRHPEWDFIYATHGADLAEKVGEDTRNKINDVRFGEIHPKLVLSKTSNAKNYFTSEAGGKATFIGVDGGALGRRAHILVVDDPFKNEQEARSELHQEHVFKFLLSVAESRLHPFGAIVVIHQRWHVDDLIGRLLKLRARPWTNCIYPMVATEDCSWRKKGESVHKERFTDEWCRLTKQTKIEAGQEWIWQAMYQQDPVLDSGMLFQRKWFKLLARDKFPENLRWYISTDFATSEGRGDYSVSQPFAVDVDDNIYFVDPFHAQVTPDVAHAATFDLYQKNDAKGIFVEKGGLWNTAQGAFRREQEKRRIYPRIIPFNRTTNKGEHASGLVAHMAAGKVFHVDSPFTRDVVIPQFMSFTGERGVKEQDDIVDAQYLPFLSWTEVRRPPAKVELPVLTSMGPMEQLAWDNTEGSTPTTRKDASKAWFASDMDDLLPGEKEEDREFGRVLPRIF